MPCSIVSRKKCPVRRLPTSRPCMSVMQTSTVSTSPTDTSSAISSRDNMPVICVPASKTGRWHNANRRVCHRVSAHSGKEASISVTGRDGHGRLGCDREFGDRRPFTHLGFRMATRKEQIEPRADSRLARDFDDTTVAGDDAVHDGKTETRAAADLLRGEEWLEDAPERRRVHSATVINDAELHRS